MRASATWLSLWSTPHCPRTDPVLVSLTPARARELELADGHRIDDATLGGVLDRAGVTLNSPDHLFYLTLDEQAALRGEGPATERGS